MMSMLRSSQLVAAQLVSPSREHTIMVTPRSQLTCHGGCPSARGFNCTCTCFGVYHRTAPVEWAETLASVSTGTAPAGVVRAANDAQQVRDEISAHVRAQVQLIRTARRRPHNRRGVNVRDRAARASRRTSGQADPEAHRADDRRRNRREDAPDPGRPDVPHAATPPARVAGLSHPLAKEMGGEEIGYLVDWVFGPEVPRSGTTAT